MIVADTSGLLAFFNSAEPAHGAVVDAVAARPDRLVISPYVIAEIDYLIATRVGVETELAVLAELTSSAYTLADFDGAALRQAIEVITRYRDLAIGVADASLVVLADRFGTHTVLTLDRRHFNALRAQDGRPFEMIP